MSPHGIRDVTLRAALCTSALLLASTSIGQERRPGESTALVRIEGVEAAYTSCELVKFSVRNVFSRDVFVNVYVENLEQGSWQHVWCQYDLNDPPSRQAKMSLRSQNLIRAGRSITVAYDRCADYEICLRHMYDKDDMRASRKMLQQADATASPQVMQRIWVTAYDPERLANSDTFPGPNADVFSQPFTRHPANKKSVAATGLR